MRVAGSDPARAERTAIIQTDTTKCKQPQATKSAGQMLPTCTMAATCWRDPVPDPELAPPILTSMSPICTAMVTLQAAACSVGSSLGTETAVWWHKHTWMPALLAGDASDTSSTMARGREYWEVCFGVPSDVCGASAVDCWNVLPADVAERADS